MGRGSAFDNCACVNNETSKMATSCTQGVATSEAAAVGPPAITPVVENHPPFPEKEFDFVERPSQDFFCPVSLELLLEPQQTSCCGNHLSLEVATRLRREGKSCPVCNGEQWSAMLDKYHRRRVHEVRVRCWNKDSGCGWVGEVNELRRHAVSCEKRPWECEYCGLKCTYGEGEGNHWPECLKFPEPCPNGCEVGSVERCGMEQHRSVCPLEPVACEMKEFGCSVMVPRKELATHMKESELQHLTAMTALNLRLTRQLQQDSTKRDRKIEKILEDSAERDRKIEQLYQEVKMLNSKVESLEKEQNKELANVKVCIQSVYKFSEHIEQHTAACTGFKVLTLRSYNEAKTKALSSRIWAVESHSENFYSSLSCCQFQLMIKYYPKPNNDMGAFLCLRNGESVQLQWPVKVKVQLQLLNQAGDHHHVARTKTLEWKKEQRGNYKEIDNSIMKYTDLERREDDVQYMTNDCLKFRIHVFIL